VVATVNDPQPSSHTVKWRAVVRGVGAAPTAATHFHVVFTSGPASADGDTGGGSPPVQRAYDAASTDFFEDLNDFMPGRDEDMLKIDPKKVISGDQSLNGLDTIALADEALPGYTGAYGRATPTGPPTPTQTFEGSSSAPGGGSGAPGTFEEHEFTIGDNDSDKTATVTVEWDLPADDFDLEVYREKPDGGRRLMGSSAGGPPDTSESVKLIEPGPGKYVVHVDNFAAPDPRWRGRVEFEPLPAAGPGTGDYTEEQKDKWFAKLREWVRDGGNLVLTDRALRSLGELTSIAPSAIDRQTVYAGQSAFAKEDSEDAKTTGDPLARGIEIQGARFNTGFRRQMYEPTPLGYAIQDEDGNDAARARQYDVDREAWEKAGGRFVAASADSGARDAEAVYDRVTIGELPMGKGQVRIAGALLPQPTEEYDHQFGLESYAVTYSGYIMARNLLDAANRAPGVVSANGNRFQILTKRTRVRKGKKGRRIVRIKVRCRSRRGCYGKLKLQVRKKKRSGKRDQPENTNTPQDDAETGPSAAAKRKSRTKLVVIGRRKFAIKKSRKKVLKVRLTLEGRRLQRRKPKLRIRAAAPVRFGKKAKGGRGTARRKVILRRAKGDKQVLFARAAEAPPAKATRP
jgi:hypothetical protein